MRTVRFFLLIVSVIITLFGCKKDNNQNLSPDVASLLTNKPWKLLSYGHDNNKNGTIDNNEEEIRDCDKDNTYIFDKNGSGVVMENEKICDGNEQAGQFTWSLINNDTELDFFYGKARIAKLSKDSLIITNPDADPVKLQLIYGH